MPKCDLNKVALLCNFIEIILWHGSSSVNLLHIFITHIPRNTFGWLLLLAPCQRSLKEAFLKNAPRKKCPYSQLLWSVFSRIRTE